MRRFFLSAFLLIAALATTANAQLRVANIFSDNMVVQRDQAVYIWGWAAPGENVSVMVKGDEIASELADDQGRWLLNMSPIKAGGDPFEIVVETKKEKIVFKNVVAGDVWICSGQSNMEWVVNNSNHADEEKANANYHLIRHVKVLNQTSSFPQDDANNSKWQVCSPETVGNFTAVGYFFGRDLHKETGVPIGLLNTSWGGTIIEAWISGESLKQHPDFKQVVEQIEAIPHDEDANKQQQDSTQKWEQEMAAAAADRSDKWETTNVNDAAWQELDAPGHWEGQGHENLDGVAWYRRTIDVPASWQDREMVLSLAKIDDNDETYVNGQKVGGENAWDTDRKYTVAKNLVKAGPMQIAVRVYDGNMGGGFHGEASAMFASVEGQKPISLAGKWKFKVGTKTAALGPRPQASFAGPNNPTVLYNAMVHPLHPFSFKGAIWYQGESNAGRAYQYRSLMPMLVQDWRAKWSNKNFNNEFPFYWVQLANFNPASNEPGSSDWAELREAQSMSLSVPHTGQAVIIDIGEAMDIHPKNKQDVGRRLALNALAKDYDKDVEFSGPTYKSMKVDGEKIRLTFEHAEGLQSKGGPLQRFEIAGEDQKFIWAEAAIEGSEVIVSSPHIHHPVAVRYAWANNPEGCNLYNASDLPASPFRTDNWKGVTQQ